MTKIHQERQSGTSTDLNHEMDMIADQFRPLLEETEQAELDAERAQREEDSLDSLRRVRALTELTRRLQAKAALRAEADGHTQREIGAALGKPQAQIHRLLRRAKVEEIGTNPPEVVGVPAVEIILQYKAGAISRGTMIGRLTGAQQGHSAGGEHDEGFVPGAWDDVREAFLTGLLTEREYEAVRENWAAGRRRR